MCYPRPKKRVSISFSYTTLAFVNDSFNPCTWLWGRIDANPCNFQIVRKWQCGYGWDLVAGYTYVKYWGLHLGHMKNMNYFISTVLSIGLRWCLLLLTQSTEWVNYNENRFISGLWPKVKRLNLGIVLLLSESFYYYFFPRQSFSVAMGPVLKLAL